MELLWDVRSTCVCVCVSIGLSIGNREKNEEREEVGVCKSVLVCIYRHTVCGMNGCAMNGSGFRIQESGFSA